VSWLSGADSLAQGKLSAPLLKTLDRNNVFLCCAERHTGGRSGHGGGRSAGYQKVLDRNIEFLVNCKSWRADGPPMGRRQPAPPNLICPEMFSSLSAWVFEWWIVRECCNGRFWHTIIANLVVGFEWRTFWLLLGLSANPLFLRVLSVTARFQEGGYMYPMPDRERALLASWKAFLTYLS